MIKIKLNFKKEDFDSQGALKISSLLLYMQKAAIKDAEKFGATHENLWKKDMFFAVYRNILTIKEIITEEVKEATLVSFQSFHDRMRFIRSYFIYTSDKCWDQDSEKSPYEDAQIYCDSIWVLMDAKKRTLLRSSALEYPVEEYTIPFERVPKVIVEQDSMDTAGVMVGKNYYIDENGHVNNASYADIVKDYTSIKEEIVYFDMTYEHEILEDESVEIFTEKSDNGEKLLGIKTKDGKICFCAEVRSR